MFSPAMGLQSSHYDAFGRMTGSPLTVRPPESQTNAPQRVPSPRFEDSLSLYRSTNECQMQIDGILQNCATVSSESIGVEIRYGDKTRNLDFGHDLPGRVLAVDVPRYDIRDADYRRLYLEGMEWDKILDLAGQMLHFTLDLGQTHGNSALPGNPTGIQVERAKVDCESFLANLFTGVSDTIFSDVTDGDPVDTLTGTNDDPANGVRVVGYMQTHNHGYNPISDPTRATQIFAPAGGRILGGLNVTSEASGKQTYVNVFYPSLGGQKNIVLQFFHIENFTGRKQADGRILLGTMGENGIWSAYPGRTKGYHYHINAWKWWGGFDNRGNPIFRKNGKAVGPVPDTLPISEGGFRSPANTFNLSNLCPK